MPGGGRLRVGVGVRRARPPAGGGAEADYLCVTVEDEGGGIATKDLPRLFEPFFTTAAPGEGTGLGLALCHATMERIGGAISARNGEKGAVFELRFRRYAP